MANSRVWSLNSQFCAFYLPKALKAEKMVEIHAWFCCFARMNLIYGS